MKHDNPLRGFRPAAASDRLKSVLTEAAAKSRPLMPGPPAPVDTTSLISGTESMWRGFSWSRLSWWPTAVASFVGASLLLIMAALQAVPTLGWHGVSTPQLPASISGDKVDDLCATKLLVGAGLYCPPGSRGHSEFLELLQSRSGAWVEEPTDNGESNGP